MSTINELLMAEFYKYESENQLTEDERNALLSWVKDGHSVHTNPLMAEDGHSNYIDFLDIYRNEKELNETLNSMSKKERGNYIAELRGEDTIDNLREIIQKLNFEIYLLEKVIAKHKLQAEVETYRQEAIEYSKTIEKLINSHPLEELPFN